MRYLLLLLTSLTMHPLFAEMTGNIEYKLPSTKKPWQKVASSESQPTVFYVPQGATLENTKEFFGIDTEYVAPCEINEVTLRSFLEKQMGVVPVIVIIIERTPDSVLYEWGMDVEGNFLFSLNRVFFSSEETTLLTYQTTNHKRVVAEKNLWLQMFREAKKVSPGT